MALIFPAPAQIKNLQDPTAASDAATKFYVDNAISGGTGVGAAGSNTQIQFNNSSTLGASANLTFNSTTNLLTVTGNIAASNANLGNLVTANFFTGNGSLLTGITATTAGTAQTVTEGAQPNITSTGTLANLTVSGDVSFTGANVSLGNVSNLHITGGSSAQILSTDGTGNLSWTNQVSLTGYATETYVGTAITNLINSAPAVLDTLGELANALGNDASFSTTLATSLSNKLNTADFNSTANGWITTQTTSNLTEGTNLYYTDTRANSAIDARVTKTFVDNLGIVANIANTANSVSGSNVSGQVANATVASTVYTNAQPNITSVGTLANLTVSGNVNLSDVSNVHILGGTADYYLKTDGTGNLSWSEVSTGSVSSVIVDSFTANGVQTSFTLSTAPANTNVTTVNYNGATLLRESYSISGSDVVFTSAPANGAKLEITTIAPIIGGYSNVQVASYLPTYSGNLSFANATVTGNIVPSANVTYDLGSPTNRWKDLYLSSNTLYLGDTSISAADILPIDLDILPEVLTIQVAAPDPGDDTTWLWTWQQSTLPFARTTITNSPQLSVPLYRQGTYQINNFANEQTGSMTQPHRAKLKWIDGAGSDNVVSWAVDVGNVVMSHPSINNGANTTVQRFNINVPSTITLPTLVAPNVSYTVSFANVGAYTIGGSAMGDNKNLGPMYRGGTYTFNLDSSITNHPFYLTTDNGTNFVPNTYFGEYTNGVTGSRNNGTTGKTTLTLVVDATTPSTLYYQCGVHSMMRGAITIKDLAVETNVNGNPILYFQHSNEGHKTPVEIRPLPSLVNQMCVVYDASTGKFVPQDLATYVENTPSFKNKIQEVAGTATLVAADGVVVVPTVSIVEDATYLPLVGNKEGDITYAQDTETLYIWNNNNWTSTKTTTLAGSAITGQVGNALVAGTVYTNAQPNITSVGTLTGLTVSGTANLSAVGNVKITGGTSGQVLVTDGTGNLSFTTVATSTPDPMHPFLLGL